MFKDPDSHYSDDTLIHEAVALAGLGAGHVPEKSRNRSGLEYFQHVIDWEQLPVFSELAPHLRKFLGKLVFSKLSERLPGLLLCRPEEIAAVFRRSRVTVIRYLSQLRAAGHLEWHREDGVMYVLHAHQMVAGIPGFRARSSLLDLQARLRAQLTTRRYRAPVGAASGSSKFRCREISHCEKTYRFELKNSQCDTDIFNLLGDYPHFAPRMTIAQSITTARGKSDPNSALRHDLEHADVAELWPAVRPALQHPNSGRSTCTPFLERGRSTRGDFSEQRPNAAESDVEPAWCREPLGFETTLAEPARFNDEPAAIAKPSEHIRIKSSADQSAKVIRPSALSRPQPPVDEFVSTFMPPPKPEVAAQSLPVVARAPDIIPAPARPSAAAGRLDGPSGGSAVGPMLMAPPPCRNQIATIEVELARIEAQPAIPEPVHVAPPRGEIDWGETWQAAWGGDAPSRTVPPYAGFVYLSDHIWTWQQFQEFSWKHEFGSGLSLHLSPLQFRRIQTLLKHPMSVKSVRDALMATCRKRNVNNERFICMLEAGRKSGRCGDGNIGDQYDPIGVWQQARHEREMWGPNDHTRLVGYVPLGHVQPPMTEPIDPKYLDTSDDEERTAT